MQIYKLIVILFICLSFGSINAQNLSFSKPINFLPDSRTDKAVDITNFKGGYFVTWKDAGAIGNIHICYLGKQYDTHFSQDEMAVGNEKTAFAPVLRVVGNHIYILWLGLDGKLHYVLNKSDVAFDLQNINTVNFENSPVLRAGITASTINGKVAIASHGDKKNDMVFAMFDADDKGILKPSVFQVIPDKKSDDYPFIVTLNNNTARICYKNASDQRIYYADYNTDNKSWSESLPVYKSTTKASPAIYHAFNTSRLFYIWKGNKKDNRIYYASDDAAAKPADEYMLPDYFKTANPVSVCNVDSKKFIMAFIGEDQKFYISYFTNYNPARWIEDTLYPGKSSLTLKDIVIPGAHDAGMSVLNGTGGLHAGSINPCNVLTQQQNIGKQLNTGIRMFDLRVGAFKNQIYTKHSSSDCMAEAMGGGYGERLSEVLDSIKVFLKRNQKEFVILTFSHFCQTEASANNVADFIVSRLGKDLIYSNKSKNISQIKLNDLAGKVIVTFEQYASADNLIDSNSIADKAKTFLNFRRAYAATNIIDKLLASEETFFSSMSEGVSSNDLIRLDWQLTQSSDEAALVCNDFQDDKVSPVINGMMLLTNVVKKNQSIRDLAIFGNKYLPAKVNEWIGNGTINKKNKPNILYVDAAGSWITDYCIQLNSEPVYN